MMIYFKESLNPFALHLDVAIEGALRLVKSEFTFDPSTKSIEIEGRKSSSVVRIRSCESARGAFRIVASQNIQLVPPR